MRKGLRENSLSLFFFAIFLAALIGQAIAGHALHNNEAAEHGGEAMSLWRYATSSDFGTDVAENWQSEYLQFFLYMVADRVAAAGGLAGVEEPRQGRAGNPTRSRRSAATPSGIAEWARAGGWRIRTSPARSA